MADMKSSEMKDGRFGWKAQVLSLYQKYFKMGEAKWPEKTKSTNNISGKERLRSAGEMIVEEGNKMADEAAVPSEHTFVELPAEQIPPPTLSNAVVEAPKVEELKGSTIEPTGEQSKNTLVIKNLPFKFKPADLDNLLSAHQAKPKNVRLLRDEGGRFSGMAFIRCSSKEEAQRLISTMNGLDIGGRNMQVEFKLKKKSKSKLDSSFDSLSSSSDELPVNRLHISNDHDPNVKVNDTVVHPPIIVHSAASQNSGATRGNKLSVSAEHLLTETKQPLKKAPFQPRRKSTSAYEPTHFYANSALPKLSDSNGNRFLPGIRPIRQPFGPDGTNGFSLDYRRSRGLNV